MTSRSIPERVSQISIDRGYRAYDHPLDSAPDSRTSILPEINIATPSVDFWHWDATDEQSRRLI